MTPSAPFSQQALVTFPTIEKTHMANTMTIEQQVKELQEYMQSQLERALQTIAVLESVNALLLASVRQSGRRDDILSEYLSICAIADAGPAYALRSQLEKDFVQMVRNTTIDRVMQGDDTRPAGPLN